MKEQTMFQKGCFRFINGFCYAVAITLAVHMLIMCITGTMQMLPEYAARFDSELKAYMTELLLIGLMSAVTSAGTVVFETRKIGLLVQSALFILIMLSAWIPVACFVWGFHKYTGSMISTVASIVATYALCRWIHYRRCKKEIEEINEMLKSRKES